MPRKVGKLRPEHAEPATSESFLRLLLSLSEPASPPTCPQSFHISGPTRSTVLQEVLPPHAVLPLEESDLRFTYTARGVLRLAAVSDLEGASTTPYVSHTPRTSREGPGLSDGKAQTLTSPRLDVTSSTQPPCGQVT